MKMKDIIIIGAGVAGLACAAHLKELGFQNVKILEARDRLGGRVFTKYFGSHCIELGAEWIHGQGDNIIFDYANANDLVNNTLNFGNIFDKFFRFVSPERKKITIELFELINEWADNFPEDFTSGTFKDYLDENFQVFLKSNISSKDILFEAYQCFSVLLCEVNGCIDLRHLSGSLLKNFKECSGDNHVEPKKGYFNVIKLFLKRIPEDWILLNKKVSKIIWSNGSNSCTDDMIFEHTNSSKTVKVCCSDGEVFLSDHTIITIPLGYLKKHSKVLFSPALSKSKQSAIDAIGFKAVNKVYLEFEEPFWKKPDVFLVFWKKSFDEHFKFDEKSSRSWVKAISRCAFVANHPNMLCLWCSGEGSDALELTTDEEVIQNCRLLLELVIGKHIPEPKRMFRSFWLTDPYTYGSYSYLSVDCEKENVSNVNLAEPEYLNCSNRKIPVLLFAGEATHSFYYSTVHGACETGIREANRINEYYRNLESSKESKGNISKMTEPGSEILYRNDLLRNCKIAIIGAGIAGLSCALQLSKSSFSNVVLLEAQDKIGGRISTINYNGGQLELGAQWIHGTENVLYKFANFHGFIGANQFLITEGRGKFHTNSGDIIEKHLVEEVREVVNRAKCLLESAQYDVDNIISVQDFFQNAYESHISNCSDTANRDFKDGLFNWFINFEVIDNSCSDLGEIAVQSYTEWEKCPEELYNLSLEHGFNSFLDMIANQLPEGFIHLNKPVKNIEWDKNFKHKHNKDAFAKDRDSKDYPVKISLENGEVMNVDCVVVTASVGYLKENSGSFFTPPLPQNKESVIKHIEFGTVNKVFLIYDQPFWSPDDVGFQLVWLMEKSKELKKLLQEHPWISGINGFDVVFNQPALVGWIGGNQAKFFEQVSIETVSYACTCLLRNFLSTMEIPEPTKVFRSQWFSNPYVRGAYSSRNLDFYKCSSSLQDLNYPICSTYVTQYKKEILWPIMLFAGEATDKNAFSALHGAFNSGHKAANVIFKACSNVKVYEEIERKR